MKKLIGICMMVAGLAFSSDLSAQSTVKKAGKKVEKGARKVGNNTAEAASKGKSKVVHTKYTDKVGPNGETIYINKAGQYYWKDKKGRRHYIQSEQLKDRIDQQ